MTKPLTDWRKQITDAETRFLTGVDGFQLDIAHDDGIYRHLRFRAPAHTFGSYWFDLHTAPGTLTFRGDMGTWVFSRTEDMLEFFRGHRVNPGYWAEKVIARDRHSDPEEYDPHVLARAVHEATIPYAEWKWDDPQDRIPFYRAVIEEVLRSDELTYEGGNGHEAVDLLMSWRFYDAAGGRQHRPFDEAYEYAKTTWGGHYLWALHAIVWGIERYDKAKAAADAA